MLNNSIRLTLSGLIFAVAVVLVGGRTVSKLCAPGPVEDAKWGMGDFRDAVYYPVVAFLDGRNPYDVSGHTQTYPARRFPIYSPLSLLIHLPFGLAPFRASQVIYFGATIALTLALAAVSLLFCGLQAKLHRVLGLAALILLCRPGEWTVVLGQVTLQAVLSTIIAIHFARRSPWLAGVALALATFKPTYGVPLALLLWLRGDHRTVRIGVGLGVAAALSVTCVLVYNEGGVGRFATTCLEAAAMDQGETIEADSLRIDAYATISRLSGGRLGSGVEWATLGIVMAAAGMALIRLRHHAEMQHGVDGLSGVLICLAVLACVYHQPYDGLLLILPLVAIAAGVREPWRSLDERLRWVIFGATAVTAVNYFASATSFAYFGASPVFAATAASANGISLLAALGLCIAIAFGRPVSSLGRPDDEASPQSPAGNGCRATASQEIAP